MMSDEVDAEAGAILLLSWRTLAEAPNTKKVEVAAPRLVGDLTKRSQFPRVEFIDENGGGSNARAVSLPSASRSSALASLLLLSLISCQGLAAAFLFAPQFVFACSSLVFYDHLDPSEHCGAGRPSN